MIKGDKIKLKKKMGVFTNIGEVCEVVDVTEGGVISFRFGGRHLGCMSYDEYLKYFEPVTEPEKSKRIWTDWCSGTAQYTDMNGQKTYLVYRYRHNGKRVHVTSGPLKAEASCHDDDKFILRKGLDLAVQRLIVKNMAEQVELKAKEM